MKTQYMGCNLLIPSEFIFVNKGDRNCVFTPVLVLAHSGLQYDTARWYHSFFFYRESLTQLKP